MRVSKRCVYGSVVENVHLCSITWLQKFPRAQVLSVGEIAAYVSGHHPIVLFCCSPEKAVSMTSKVCVDREVCIYIAKLYQRSERIVSSY